MGDSDGNACGKRVPVGVGRFYGGGRWYGGREPDAHSQQCPLPSLAGGYCGGLTRSELIPKNGRSEESFAVRFFMTLFFGSRSLRPIKSECFLEIRPNLYVSERALNIEGLLL